MFMPLPAPPLIDNSPIDATAKSGWLRLGSLTLDSGEEGCSRDARPFLGNW